MITDDMVATWKMNYGLDTRGPAEAMKWWVDAMDGRAPAGAVAALGLLLEERDELRKDAERYRFVRDADKSDGLISDIALYAMDALDEYVDDAMAEWLAHGERRG